MVIDNATLMNTQRQTCLAKEMDIFRLKRDDMIYIKQIYISYLDSDAIFPILPSGPSPRLIYTKSI